MSYDKRCTLDILGIPKEFGVVVLTFVLILALSPYLGGIDLGIFKVPILNPQATWVLVYLGPVLLVLVSLLFLPCWQKKLDPSVSNSVPVPNGKIIEQEDALPVNSKFCLQSVADIVKLEAAKQGIQIDGLQIGDRLHINDLERICTKAWYPKMTAAEVNSILQAARAKAFSLKYAKPREDEKLRDVGTIKIDNLKRWEFYFYNLLHELGVEAPNQLNILNVGIGNGYAEDPFFSTIHSFKAVDISNEALQYAREKFPQMTSFVCAAEDLKPILNNSVDFYLSLRTYQSTLFDRRAALHEAYRVIRNGGIILLSVPIMYVLPDGNVIAGLIPPGSSKPNMTYARGIVKRIHDYLTILNFKSVKTDERSPFEIFLSAKR